MNESFWIFPILLFLTIQAGIWLLIFNKLSQRHPAVNRSDPVPVSIIICARNARHHLERNLPKFLAQKYPEFELILVDDDSDDGTEEWIKSILVDYPRLRYYRNHKTSAGKKQALNLGISNASHSWIALSDADCKPGSPFWLKTMMSNVSESTKIVLGYAPYEKNPGLLNKLIRLETVLNAIQYLSAADLGFPYMGCGRNLVYHKSIFDTQSLQVHLAYGDDDLLINAKSTKENTVFSLHPDSFIYSNPATSYPGYFKQKWRHYAAAHEYSWGIKMYLFIYFISLVGFYGSFVALLFFKLYAIAFICLISKMVFTWPVFYKQCRVLNEKDLINYFPLLSWMYVVHLIFQIPFLWIKKKKW